LPDYGAHVIKPYAFTKFNNLSSYGYYFISAVINSAGELVANIYAKTATVVQDPVAFFPDQIQVIDIIFVTVIKTYLVFVPIVF
jgi:hypothetical protein